MTRLGIGKGDLARRRDIWWQFTVRAIAVRHRGSYLGALWSVLQPLLMLGLYAFVFGTIFGGSFHARSGETKMDYALALFLGLIFFNVLADTLGSAPALLLAQASLVKRTIFPLEVLPLAQLGAAWFNFLVSLILLLLGATVVSRGVRIWGLLWLPVIILPHLALTIGLGWFLAALGVFLRDIQHATQFAAQVLLYASAVFYSPGIIGPTWWAVLRWNPFLHTIDLARDALLWGLPLNLWHLLYTYFAGGISLGLGLWFFEKTRPAFADVL